MSTYTQISIIQDPKIHGSEHLSVKEVNDSIMITIDGSSIKDPVDICTGSIGEMRQFAKNILKICDEAERNRRIHSKDFGMFSDEGNEAVSDEINSYDRSLLSDSDKFASIVEAVSLAVYKKGFPEVYDTVVRENLWNFLEAKELDG
jgi:hypothetical protein